MKSRCLNANSSDYSNYGGRGVQICPEWLGVDGFVNFYNWSMANGYSDDLTIERKNNHGNYCPENCCWIERKRQSRNRRNVVLLTYNGETMSCAEWSKKLGLYSGTVNNRLHKGYSVEECLFGRKETERKIPKKYRKQEE